VTPLLPRFVQGTGLGLLYVPLNVLMMTQSRKSCSTLRPVWAASCGKSAPDLGSRSSHLIVHTADRSDEHARRARGKGRAQTGARRPFTGGSSPTGYNDSDAQAFCVRRRRAREIARRSRPHFPETFIIVGLLFSGAALSGAGSISVRGKGLESA